MLEFLKVHEVAVMASCASRTSCSTCYSNTSLCHWCPADRKCHSQLSLYGCAVGVSCYQENCFRPAPEATSAQLPSFVEFLELLLLFSFILFCAGFCVHVGNAFKSATSTVTKRRDERYVSMSDIETNESEHVSMRAPSREEEWSVPIVELETETALGRGVQCVLKWCCVCFVSTIGILLMFVLVVYPHTPTYSVCNSELDWGSLLSSLSSLKLAADYDVAMSVKNPNIFDIYVDSLDAVFSFEGTPVAAVHMKRMAGASEVVKLEAVTITDVLLPLTFAPESISQAVHLSRANSAGTLKFTASFSIKGTAMGFYNYDVEVKDHVVDLSTMGDTSLCAPCSSVGDR